MSRTKRRKGPTNQDKLIGKYPPSEPCSCDICLAYCRRPGWWTVEEAAKAITIGHANRMMLEISPELTFGVLSPAFKGNEGNIALQIFAGQGCTFLKDNRCELFGTGAQPLECRFCHHSRLGLGERCHRAIEKDWYTQEGQKLVIRWGEATGFFARQGLLLPVGFPQINREKNKEEQQMSEQAWQQLNEYNRTETDRIKELADRLTDKQLLTPMPAGWTVSAVLAHLAFWDIRAIKLIDLWRQNGVEYSAIDTDVINEVTRELFTGLPPRIAAQIAIAQAVALDQLIAELAAEPDFVEQIRTIGKNVILERYHHRRMHLGEIEQILMAQ